MNDHFMFWRIQDELTVPNVAILMVGGDPGVVIEKTHDDFGPD